LVLTNTVYFNAEWQNKFEKEATEDLDFWVTLEQKVKTPMMHQEGYFGYNEDETLQILTMPYRGTNMSMVVILPKKIDGISLLESQLDSKALKKWTSNFKMNKINVFIPKFKTTQNYDLKDILISLGMSDAFSQIADFSGMEPKRELYISDVVHKAFIDVDEEGTEAAAATAVPMPAGAAPQTEKPPEFRADHPFLFLIQDNETGSILFIGRLMKPS
jgi:serpin B